MHQIFISCILSTFLISSSADILLSQSQPPHWYLLKSIVPVSDVEAKSLMNEIQSVHPGLKIWYNGSKSNTFGCHSDIEVNWPSILPGMMSEGYYIADITKGQIHGQGVSATSSYHYIRGRYYASHPDELEEDQVFEFNQAEWDLLPPFAQNFFTDHENYVVVPK